MPRPAVSVLPLRLSQGHLFMEHGTGLWLLDTGAPTSFGHDRHLNLAGETFSFDDTYHGLDVGHLAEHVGVACVGLLGGDVLCSFDMIIDVPGGTLTLTTGDLEPEGEPIPLWEFVGLPIVTARIAGADYRMFFDTGAHLSYFQDPAIKQFPEEGMEPDFFPDGGDFVTQTHRVEMSLGGIVVKLRCGTLPQSASAALTMANATGIVGNELLLNRRVGFLPRQGALVL